MHSMMMSSKSRNRHPLPTMDEDEPSAAFELTPSSFFEVDITEKSELSGGSSSFYSRSNDGSSDFLIDSDHRTLRTTSTSNAESTIASGDTIGDDSVLSEEEKTFKTRLNVASKKMRLSTRTIETEGKAVILDPTKKKEKERKINKFKAGRLKISNLKLHGRETEVRRLLECLETVYLNSKVETATASSELEENVPSTTSDNGSQPEQKQQRGLILLKGYSGTGKTALAKSLVNQVENKYNGLFVSGKYDLYLRDEPYFGIIAACREICGAILMLRNHDDRPLDAVYDGSAVTPTNLRSFEAIQTKLIDELEEDIYLLMDMIPELDEVVSHSDLMKKGLEKPTEGLAGNQQENKAKLHYIFRLFLRIITSFFGPFIMVLDDLQWADMGSLDLMEVIMTDRDNPNFIIIGLYRSNEVDGTHLLSKKLTNLQEINRKQHTILMEEIEVGNLSYEAVKAVTTELLSLDDTPESEELAKLCHSRTQGNVFFLISFLTMLEEEKLLDYSLDKYRYTWNIEEIKAATGASDNVVDLMKNKMSKLATDYRKLLSIGACLGASFGLENLELVWMEFHNETSNGGASVEDMVKTIIEEGLVERNNGWKSYRWIHDKIQEAAYTLIPKDELSDFQVRVGNILCSQMSKEELESSLFLVMNLLNEATGASVSNPKQQLRLAELNLQAAQKSASFSAFSSTHRYTQKGIEFLPKDSWKSHYKLTLELYSFAAEAAVFLGKETEMKSFCSAILDSPLVPITDHYRANLVLTDFLMGNYQEPEAGEVMIKVLKKFGIKFPKREPGITLSVIKNLLTAKSLIKNYTLDHARNVPYMLDIKHIQSMKYLAQLWEATYLSADPLSAISILKATRITANHGLCGVSPSMFMMTGLIFASTGDFKGAADIGEYALTLLSRVPENAVPLTKHIGATFVFCWTKPFSFVMNMALESYQKGMAIGDTSTAGYIITVYNLMQYQSGRRLSIIYEDCKAYAGQFRDLGRDAVVDFLTLNGQMILNLMGRSDHTIKLEGEMIPDIDDFCERSKDNIGSTCFYYAFTQRLSLMFEDYDRGYQVFVDNFNFWDKKVTQANHLFMDNVFTGGMCSFEMAIATGKAKYKRAAKKAHSIVKNWCNKGNLNVQHYNVIFNAQMAVLQQKHNAAEKLFQEAISLSARGGYIHDAGLCCELYTKLLVSPTSSRKDMRGATFQFEKAIEFYEEWGAARKVEHLMERYPGLAASNY